MLFCIIFSDLLLYCFNSQILLKAMDQKLEKGIWLKSIMYAGAQMDILFIGKAILVFVVLMELV